MIRELNFDDDRARARFGDNEYSQSANADYRSDLKDFTLILRSDKADKAAIGTAVPAAGAHAPTIWLPRSQITYTRQENNRVLVTMPAWLARKNGLL